MKTLQSLLEMGKSTKRADVPTASTFEFEKFEQAFADHCYQVMLDDFELDGETATARFSSPEGQGDVKLTLTAKYMVLDVRGEGESGKKDEMSGVKFPYQDYKTMAEEVDEYLGSFAHDLAEDEDD